MPSEKIKVPTNDREILEQIAFIIFIIGFRFSIVNERWPKIKKAFFNFKVDKVASVTDKDIEKLVLAPGMIKNRRKIRAIISNAKKMKAIRKKHGTVKKWIAEIKRMHTKDPLFNPTLNEEFIEFDHIGKTTSGWLAAVHSAKGKYYYHNEN